MIPHKLRSLVVVGCVAFLAAVACTPGAQPLPVVPLPTATPAPPISFPRDAGPHDSLTEWWYYTGHLSTPGGQPFGFEFVVFQVTRANQPTGYLAHFAISDIGAQRFSHQARFAQSATTLSAFPLNVAEWSLGHEPGLDTIHAAMEPGAGGGAYTLNLQLRDGDKPPALHGGGYITYGPAGGSYYYSRTRLSASGTLITPDGAENAVSGIAWMDHQWGNFVVTGRGGWDWYSLQLDDDTELMLYVLRDGSGATTAVYGSQVAADGHVSDLPPRAVQAEATGTWTSPHTGAEYPSGWLLTLPDSRRLVLTPQLQDQELYFPGEAGAALAYWEGAVTISGDTSGVGYVELTGYSDQVSGISTQ
jgi:predicted secreted hydrolase